jgi:molybdopterin-guanine dinucleotide biosynthesis protein A
MKEGGQPPMKTAALILAGGKNKPDMAAACGGIENRALVPLNGRPMLDFVVDAVRAGFAQREGGGRILVAGDVPTPAGCVAVAGGASLVDTLLNGAAALNPDETRLLVVTADIPFLTPEAVSDLLERATALPTTPQFVYPIVEAAVCRKRFPEMRRTTLRIAEGDFTGGNLALLDPGFLRQNEAVLRNGYAQRKSVTGLARILGVSFLFRLLLSRLFPGVLTIPLLEAAVGRALGGATARAVITPFAEIGTDVDRPEDIQIAQKLLSAP